MADLLLLIRGGAMPKSCMDCMLNFECRGCMVTGEDWWSDSHVYLDFDPNEERLHSCPLVELPDHGDLIDRAELLRSTPDVAQDDMWVPYVEGYSEEAIMKARPIIPASKEGGE